MILAFRLLSCPVSRPGTDETFSVKVCLIPKWSNVYKLRGLGFGVWGSVF